MGHVIEVGANWGDDTAQLLSRGDIVYAFEPTPEMVVGLQQKFSGKDNFYPVPMAVDLEEGWAWFNISTHTSGGVSSLYEFNPRIDELWAGPNFFFSKRIRVMKTRLDTFLAAQGVDKVDYLWIDAQGNDFRVLQSLGERIDAIKEGKCEAAYSVELYRAVDNDYRSIAHWLQERGFEVAIVPEGGQKEADVHFRRR